MKVTIVKSFIRFASACVVALVLSVAHAGAQTSTKGARAQKEEAARPAPWAGCFYEAVGGRPKGIEEFENFFVRSFPGQPVSGGLITKTSNLVHTFSKVEVTGDRLTFTTLARRGVTYSFEGQLLKKSESDEGGDALRDRARAAVAEGTLRKHRRGKQIAEARVRLGCGEAGEGVD
jgi:hypothetical protein